jgi:hypothetical protein
MGFKVWVVIDSKLKYAYEFKVYIGEV